MRGIIPPFSFCHYSSDFSSQKILGKFLFLERIGHQKAVFPLVSPLLCLPPLSVPFCTSCLPLYETLLSPKCPAHFLSLKLSQSLFLLHFPSPLLHKRVCSLCSSALKLLCVGAPSGGLQRFSQKPLFPHCLRSLYFFPGSIETLLLFLSPLSPLPDIIWSPFFLLIEFFLTPRRGLPFFTRVRLLFFLPIHLASPLACVFFFCFFSFEEPFSVFFFFASPFPPCDMRIAFQFPKIFFSFFPLLCLLLRGFPPSMFFHEFPPSFVRLFSGP